MNIKNLIILTALGFSSMSFAQQYPTAEQRNPTALYLAADSGDLNAVKKEVLALQASGNISQIDTVITLPNCYTALGIAAQKNFNSIVEFLLSNKADPNRAQYNRNRYAHCDWINNTSLDIALKNGNLTLAQTILDYSKKTDFPTVYPLHTSTSSFDSVRFAFDSKNFKLYTQLIDILDILDIKYAVSRFYQKTKDDPFYWTGSIQRTLTDQLLSIYTENRDSIWKSFVVQKLTPRSRFYNLFTEAPYPKTPLSLLDYAVCEKVSDLNAIKKIIADGNPVTPAVCSMAAGTYDSNMECHAFYPVYIQKDLYNYFVQSNYCPALPQ